MFTFDPTLLVTPVVVIALVGALKKLIPPVAAADKWHPALAVGVGVACAVLAKCLGVETGPWPITAVTGLFLGLAAAGLYDQRAAVTK